MTQWQPNALPPTAILRSTMYAEARKFFAERSVIEVDTPALSSRATMDGNIASIRAIVATKEAFLVTSPEYHMKRLLAAGYPDIYQIAKVFRDGESGRFHLPEFTMAEWYRLNFQIRDIISDAVEFITRLFGTDINTQPAVSMSYRQVFQQSLNIDPLDAGSHAIASAIGADTSLQDSLADDRDAWLDLAMAEYVAPNFDKDRLTVVHHYPISQASLARQCPANSKLSDRFEIYYGTLELANGFVELIDGDTQRKRFENDRQFRQENNLPQHAIDEKLIAALRAGLPPCAGVAVGLDRLLMIRARLDHIRDTVTFLPAH